MALISNKQCNRQMRMRAINIGDRIRFLSAAGGGIVRRIDGKVAWVEDEDGFEIPTPISECIPVHEGDSFIPGYKQPQVVAKQQASNEQQKKHFASEQVFHEEPPKQKPLPLTHLLVPERPNGNEVSIYLAWLPVDTEHFGASPIECYLINDCNYTLYYQLWAGNTSDQYEIISEGEIERDTKLFIEEIPTERIAHREKLVFSYIPFKRERPFEQKPAHTITPSLDVLRLLKKHAYRENDFFDEDALVIPLIEKDKVNQPKKLTQADFEQLTAKVTSNKDETLENEKRKQREQRLQRKTNRNKKEAPLEIDLHIQQLVTNTAGLENADILAIQLTEFRKVMDEVIHSKGQRVVFIHGKGEGILRKRILDELKHKYPNASAQDASYKEYGFGATMVIIH